MSFSTSTIGVFTGAGTSYRSVANALTRVFCGIRVTQLSVSSIHLMPSHCHFGILYGFLALFFNYFLLATVLNVLLRYTESGYPFGIFKLFLLCIFVS